MQRLEQWLPSLGACGAPWECLGVGGRRRAEGLGAPRGAGRAQGLRSGPRGRLQRVLTLAKISPLLKTERGERFLALKKRWNFF